MSDLVFDIYNSWLSDKLSGFILHQMVHLHFEYCLLDLFVSRLSIVVIYSNVDHAYYILELSLFEL